MKITEKIREILLNRRLVYQQLFTESETSKAVLEDLARFCRGNDTCFHADPRIHAVLEGRREVYLRILNHIKLSPDEFLKKYERKDTE